MLELTEHLLEVLRDQLLLWSMGLLRIQQEHDTDLVVQDLILFLQASHECILGQIILSRRVLSIGSSDLFIQCLDSRWYQSCEIELFSLLLGESSTLIQVRAGQEFRALVHSH